MLHHLPYEVVALEAARRRRHAAQIRVARMRRKDERARRKTDLPSAA